MGPDDTRQTVDIVVDVAAPIDDFRSEELTRALAELLEDLGVAAVPRVTLRRCEDGGNAAAATVAVRIANAPCRMNRERPRTLVVNDLVATVAHAVFDNRALLFPDLAAHGETYAQIPIAAREAALSHALRLGLPLRTAMAVLDAYDEHLDSERWIEDGLAAAIDPGVRVHAAPEEVARLRQLGAGGSDDVSLEGTVQLARDGLLLELGIRWGAVELVADEALSGAMLRLEAHGIRRPTLAGVPADCAFVNDTPVRLRRLLAIHGIPAREPMSLSAGSLIHQTDLETAKAAGLTGWNASKHLAREVAGFVRRNAASFLTITQVEYALAMLSEIDPQLVHATLSSLSSARLCRVLRELLVEEVSIRNLDDILEALVELYAASATEPTLQACVAHVRQRLARYICQRVTKDGKIICALLDETLEVRIAEQASRGVTAEEACGIVEAIVADVASDDGAALNQIVLVGAASRRALRDLVSIELPSLRVVTYEELADSPVETEVIPLATIALD